MTLHNLTAVTLHASLPQCVSNSRLLTRVSFVDTKRVWRDPLEGGLQNGDARVALNENK